MSRRFILIFACLALVFGPAQAAKEAAIVRSEAHSFRVARLLDGLEHPWSIAFLQMVVG